MRHVRQFSAALVLLALCATSASAQQRRITGRVTGQGNGEPLGSAAVSVVGTTTGTYTNEAGVFSVVAPDGNVTLRVRRIGYKQAQVAVPAGQSEVNVALARDVLQLETQVVTGTATNVSSRNAANAVSQVSGENLNRAPTPTIDNALAGKIPGAVVSQNSGAPGGGTQVQLRGVTSINASSSPVYVVDGVLVSNTAFGTGLNTVTNAGTRTLISASQDQAVNRIADLNPADIENIEVLKGASAGAIYGSKGSNGVIIITTKRGQTGRPQLSAIQRVGQFQISKKLNLRCFGSAEEAQTWWEDIIGGEELPAPYTGQCNDFEDQYYGGNGPSYETDLSVRGGANNTTYYIGGLAKRDNAIARNSFYQKQSVSANISQLIGSRLTLRSNNQFIHSLTDRGISGNDNSPIVSPGDVFSATPTFYNLRAKENGLYQPNPFLGEGTNPFQTADLVKNPENVYRYIGSINATLSAYASARQTLDFTVLGGLDTYQMHSKLLSPPEAFFESADGQPGTIVTNNANTVFGNLNASGAHRFISNLATATTSFGVRQQRRQYDQLFNQGKNIPAGVQNVDFAVNQALDEEQLLIKDFAYFAQEELLMLDERLLLTAAVNSERSSVNGDPDKFYSYPKFAASYRIPFLPRFTDELKVRLAYGKAGNQPPYGYAFTALPTGIYSGQIGARPSLIAGSSNIKPETSTEIEGGFDAQFLNGRVAFDATVFRKDVVDLILQANTAYSSGYTTRYINGGEMYNTGTELGLNITPVQRGSISWVSRTTFANVNNRVTKLDVPCFNGGSYFSIRYGAPWVCEGNSITSAQRYNGYDTTFNSAGQFVSRARHLETLESAPDFTMGFSNDLHFGAFRVYSLLDWRKGGLVANLTNNYFDGTQLLADTARTNARYASYLKGYGPYLEPAGFLKLREVTLSYTLPQSITGRLLAGPTRDIRLELSGRNLKTWTKYSGYDPEVSNFSNQNIGRFQDVTPYPPSRSYFFSVVANF